jgi:iron complex outermembrane receptor protein
MFKMTKVGLAAAIVAGGFGLCSATVFAQGEQRVEITGTAIKRIDAETALPVQVLSSQDIARTGVQTTEQLLLVVSAISTSGQTVTSMGSGLSTYGTVGVSLRGIGEERTLVLVNGRRLAPFSGGGGASVNVNNIPLAAVERVEVLKDGASAIYGSDAVAGVVNFILKKDYKGVEIGGNYLTPTESGGGEQYNVNIVGGWGDLDKDRFNLTASAQYSRNKELFGRDRSFAKTANNPPYYESGATGQGNIQGAWQPGVGGITVGGLAYRRASGSAYGNPFATPTNRCGEINMALSPSLSSAGKPFCNFDTGPFVGLLGETETASFTGSFVFRLNNATDLYADALYSRTVAFSTFQPSPLRTSFLETDEEFDKQGIDRVLLLRPDNPNYSTAASFLNANGFGALVGQPLGITARVFDFGPRQSEDTSTQTRLVGGVRGEVMNQTYDVAAAYNENKLEGTVINGYFSQVGFAKATQAPGTNWNPWSLNQTPEFLAAIAPAKYVGPTLDGKSKSTSFDATLTGDIMKLPAGSMQYAAGYQYRSEDLVQTPSPAQYTGDIAGLGGATKPIDADRSINALFAEVSAPVVKGLDLSGALRWDDYSDFGSTTNWKANARWQPMQQVLLRASYGTGFRAPTLTDLYSPIVLQTSSQFNDPVTGQSDLQVNEFNGGNPNLQPEESKQFSVGIVFQPMPSLAIGIDYFDIKVENIISQPSTQEVVSEAARGNPAYTGLVVRNPQTNEIISTSTQLSNTGTLDSEGIDLDVRWRQQFGPGRLDVSLTGTYYLKFDQSTPGAGTVDKIATIVQPDGNSPVISSTANLDGYGVVLRYKQYLSGTWTQGDWATTLAADYASRYRAGNDLNDNPTYIGGMTLWNLQVSYMGLKNAVLTLGARNILDKQPPVFVPVSNQFQSGFDASQYDPRGRAIYLTGTYKFF